MISTVKELPDEEQVSDEFGIYTDGEYYYAVRAPEEGGWQYAAKHKNKQTLIAEAVEDFHNYLKSVRIITPIPKWENREGIEIARSKSI